SGASRTILITPLPDKFGIATITVTVSDGAATRSDSFSLRVLAVNNFLWAGQETFIDPEIASGYAVPSASTTDAAGNSYVAGYFYGQVQFGAFMINNAGQNWIMFLLKVDANGNYLWVRQAADPGDPEDVLTDSDAGEVVLDNSGNIYISGAFEGWATSIGGVPLTPGGNSYIAKFDPSGNAIW